MAKVKNWLFSMDAKGHLGHQLTGQGSLGGQRVQPYRKPGGKPSERQETQRAKWKYIMSMWRKNYDDVNMYWDNWNKSRQFAKKPTTSLGLFQTQMLWADWYVRNFYFCILTKLKLWNEKEERFYPAEDASGMFVYPQTSYLIKEGVEEGKQVYTGMILGITESIDWWDQLDAYFYTDLNFEWKYGIFYGKYSDGWNESEEMPLFPIVYEGTPY